MPAGSRFQLVRLWGIDRDAEGRWLRFRDHPLHEGLGEADRGGSAELRKQSPLSFVTGSPGASVPGAFVSGSDEIERLIHHPRKTRHHNLFSSSPFQRRYAGVGGRTAGQDIVYQQDFGALDDAKPPWIDHDRA